MTTAPIRILCVDDHGFLIDGLSARFEIEKDIDFVGSLDSADDLLSAVRTLKPTIVMLDIEMPGADPFDAAKMLHQMNPEVRTVFLSAYVRDHYITAAVDAGASGYFSKGDDTETIITGLRAVSRGKFASSPAVQARLKVQRGPKRGEPAKPTSKLDSLSPRELQILRMIGRGLGRAEIAESAFISPKTVDNHRESIMRKLDIHDRAELVRFAIGEGIAEV